MSKAQAGPAPEPVTELIPDSYATAEEWSLLDNAAGTCLERCEEGYYLSVHSTDVIGAALGTRDRPPSVDTIRAGELVGPGGETIGALREAFITHSIGTWPTLYSAPLVSAILRLLAQNRPFYCREQEPAKELFALLERVSFTLKGKDERIPGTHLVPRIRPVAPPWGAPKAPPLRIEVSKPKRQPARRGPMPQPTAQEIRNPAIALADGPFRLRWEESPGETALIHTITGNALQTKLTGSVLPWWGLSSDNANLWNVLTQSGIPAVLLLFETLGRLLELPPGQAHVTVSTDELAQAIGLVPQRRTAIRTEAREKVYKLLLTLEALEVHGCRDGKWRDPKTGEVLDLTSQDPLLRITGRRRPPQATLDGSDVPIEVSFTYGAWLERFHGNRQILSDIGDFRRLAAIPTGKPTGALAQRIGLALQQRWREQASRVEVGHAGEANRPTVRLAQHFTRRALCELFRGEPDIEALLASDNPRRARDYWRDAIAMLGRKRSDTDADHAGLIGYYKEIDPTPASRRDWQAFWYDEQRLDIRPCQEITEQIAEVNTTAKKARAARTARSRSRKARESA